jgi:hypothetical protein
VPRPSFTFLASQSRPFLLFLLFLPASILSGDSTPTLGCTYYASPSGGGDGSSPSSPFRVSEFWSRANPGMSLCLLDGIYVGSDSMITPPANLNGSRGVPVVVRALNDGKVFINGQSVRRPVFLNYNDWFLVEGVNACCSSSTVVEIANSSNDVIRRVAGWDAHDGNDKIFGIHSATRNLLEDVAGWGTARKTFEFSYGGDFTTVRRAWGRWERSTVAGPKMVYSLVYNNYGALIENSLGTWSGERMPAVYTLLDYAGRPYPPPVGGTYTNYDVEEPYGIFSADGLDGSDKNARGRLLGSVAYTTATDIFKPQSLLFVTKLDGIQIRDSVGYYDSRTRGGRYTFELHSLTDGSRPQNDVAANISSFGRFGTLISDGWERSNIVLGNDPPSTYGSGETVFDTTRGASLCYAYEDGVLTNRPLWPWPMNDRIRDALLQSGRVPLEITSAMQQMFGPIPPQCTATPTSPPGATTLPVAGRVAGWTTDLQVANPGDRATEALLTFTPAGGLPPATRTLFLRARQSATFTDAIQTVFGYPEAVGSFRLLPGIEAAPLQLNGRIYAASSAGTVGAGVSGVQTSAPGVGLSHYVTGLANTAAFRSTIGAANGTDSAQTFQIAVRNSSGSVLGTTDPIVLQPAEQMQWSLPSLFPNAVGQPLTAEFRPVGASFAPLGYAMVVDNASGDPTYYSSSEPATLAYLPAVARISGAGGTLWLTDVTLTNPGETPALFTVTFLEHDRDNTTPPASRSVSLAAHQTIQVVDVLRQWFDLSETYGALKVSASSFQGPVLSARMYTRSPASSGTVGQQIGSTRRDDLLTAGSLSGLRQDDAFRSIVGFLNPGTSTVAVQLFLQNQDGGLLASSTLSLPPVSYAQRSLSGLFPAADFSPGQFVGVVFNSGSDSIAAFASTVDNASQDLTFSRATPGTGHAGPLAGPFASFTVAPACQTCRNTMQFTDTSTNFPISWTWDFGDGGTSTVQNPAHYFAASGTYTVTLAVSNATGSDTTRKTVVITLGGN